MSLSTVGGAGDGTSGTGDVSSDGRLVSIASNATNLVAGDTNGVTDVFVRDRDTGTTSRVSVASDGSEGNGPPGRHAMSGDGRYVAFWSDATNLVPGDTNGVADVFVHDRQTGITERVSVSTAGDESNGVDEPPLYIQTIHASSIGISNDGAVVAFVSGATNLVAGDTNGHPDVFVRDRSTGETSRVSVSDVGDELSLGAHYPVVSGDGSAVAFASFADVVTDPSSDGMDAYVHDLASGDVSIVSISSAGDVAEVSHDFPTSFPTSLSDDGQIVAFWSASYGLVPEVTAGSQSPDLYVRDRQASTTSLGNVADNGSRLGGSPARAELSGDGEHLIFNLGILTSEPNVTRYDYDVWRRDLVAGTTVRISVAPERGSVVASGASSDGSTIAASHLQLHPLGGPPGVDFQEAVVFDRPI